MRGIKKEKDMKHRVDQLSVVGPALLILIIITPATWYPQND